MKRGSPGIILHRMLQTSIIVLLILTSIAEFVNFSKFAAEKTFSCQARPNCYNSFFILLMLFSLIL